MNRVVPTYLSLCSSVPPSVRPFFQYSTCHLSIHTYTDTYEGESNENLTHLIFFISQFTEHKRYTMTSFFYAVSIAFHTRVPALRKCMDTSRKKFFWLDLSHSCTACYTSSSYLKDFMNFLVHSYTCCSDRHASPY
jgi:hypothetical protein